MHAVALQDLFHLLTGCPVQFCVRVLHRIEQEGQGYHIETRVKGRIDQVGMHGYLHRIPVHQGLDALGLVSIGKLVGSIDIHMNFAACGLFHHFTEFTPCLSPGAGLCGGAGKVPGLLLPGKVASVFHFIIT